MKNLKIGSLYPVLTFAALLTATPAFAQDSGMFIYPAKGQDQAQQDKDRYECHSWAVQQTGFDPSKPQRKCQAFSTESVFPASPGSTGSRSRGRARSCRGCDNG